MGILLNSMSIFIGGALGSALKSRVKSTKTMMQALGVAVMFISMINVVSNSLIVSNQALQTKNILIIVFSLLIGTFIGEITDIDGRLQVDEGSRVSNKFMLGFISGTMLFAVGGLQISGPISCMLNGDNSVLITKCFVDFPLAVFFGAMLGKGVSFSALPVGIMQLIIGAIALAARDFFSAELIAQLNAMGYLILFFVGLNMVFEGAVRIKTNNMLPSLGVIIIYNLTGFVIGGAL